MTDEFTPTPHQTAEDAGLAAARRTLALEIDGLQRLSAQIDTAFLEALRRLAAVEGRVVVTGMGKSGHIARKIAATLASTGQPSLFVHPAEASHGDLGMIGRSDAVIALSNSGETSELGDIIAYTRRFGILLVAITGRDDSTLARAADVALVLPAAPEACPHGLAPTTSTTMSLALGDALAVALLERRGFTEADFQVFHPGGKLGRKLLRTSDLMHAGAEMPVCPVGTRMADALVIMTGGRFGCVGILTDDGHLAGVITDGDLRRHMSADLLDRPVENVMTSGPITIEPDALAARALDLINSSNITVLFVVQDGRPVGIVHAHDLLRAGVA